MLRRIVFTKNGSNTLTGNFGPGTYARVPARLAAHLVEEVQVARYDEPAPQGVSVEVPTPDVGRTRTRRRRTNTDSEE